MIYLSESNVKKIDPKSILQWIYSHFLQLLMTTVATLQNSKHSQTQIIADKNGEVMETDYYITLLLTILQPNSEVFHSTCHTFSSLFFNTFCTLTTVAATCMSHLAQ